MNNNILTKIVIACLCCCTMLVAKTHIDDQVDPSILEKIAVEAQAAEALQEPAKSPKVERKNVIKTICFRFTGRPARIFGRNGTRRWPSSNCVVIRQ